MMKTLKKVLISLTLGLFLVNMAMANAFNPVIKVEHKKLYLSMNKVTSATQLKMVDEQGTALMYEQIKPTDRFDKVFDLERLPQGTYKLVIQSPEMETQQPLLLTAHEVILDESARAAYFPVVFSENRAKVNFSLANPSNSTVRVIVLDRIGRMCLQKTIQDKILIEQTINLKQLPKGHYTVVVDNGVHTYHKQLNRH